MDIFNIVYRLLVVISVIIFNINYFIVNKDKITKFFKNLFTKGKKKKLTEPEPVTEAPISSPPPHKRKRMRPPKPKRPKIELHPLRFVGKVFGWISAKAKLVAQAIKKASSSNDIDKNLFSFKQLKTLYEPTNCVIDGERTCAFTRLCERIAAPFNKIDADKVFDAGCAVLGIAAYATLSVHTNALDG